MTSSLPKYALLGYIIILAASAASISFEGEEDNDGFKASVQLSNLRMKRRMMRNPYYRYQNGPKALRLAQFFLKNRKWASQKDIEYAEGVIRRFKAMVQKAQEEERRRLDLLKTATTAKPYTLGPQDKEHILRSA